MLFQSEAENIMEYERDIIEIPAGQIKTNKIEVGIPIKRHLVLDQLLKGQYCLSFFPFYIQMAKNSLNRAITNQTISYIYVGNIYFVYIYVAMIMYLGLSNLDILYFVCSNDYEVLVSLYNT